MEKPKYKQIFNNFKKNSTPLPKILLKINQQNKNIEKILLEMDKNYTLKKQIPKKKKKIENKTRNKNPTLKDEEAREKIDFGPVTYLTYKENIEDDMNLRRYNFEFLRQKVLKSKNFRIGFFDKSFKNIKKFQLKHDNKDKKNYSDKTCYKNNNRININVIPYEEDKNKNDKKEIFKNDNSNEIKYDKRSENYNILETGSNINRDFNNLKSTFSEINNIFPINENTKEKNANESEINFIIDNITNLTNRKCHSNKNNSLTTRTNLTNYSSRNYTSTKNIPINYSITNYLDKKRPVDLKEITNKSKTSSNFNDYKDLFKYYRTNNNFLNISNANINTNINNTQVNPFLLLNKEIINIDDMAQSHKKKLNRTAKKKLNMKFIEKLIKKNNNTNSIIEILTNGKKRKIKLRTNFNKIKKQVEHLSIVDKVEKYSDSNPTEILKSFNDHYNSKCEKIGISDKNITLKNGKIYQKSKSDSKKLSIRISQNCDEIYKLVEQILIDRFYFEEKDSKCKRLLEKIKKEKIDLSVNKK
jgi:hypothetical protein